MSLIFLAHQQNYFENIMAEKVGKKTHTVDVHDELYIHHGDMSNNFMLATQLWRMEEMVIY